MSEDEVIQMVQVTPYKAGGADLSGMDCWGLIEYWYRVLRGINLTDRCGISGADSPDFSEGYKRSQRWSAVHMPKVHDVAVMPSVHMQGGKRQIIENGHCGIVTRQGILHISAEHGARLDGFNSPFLKRVGFIRYVAD